jgi:hypothetical protein
MVPQSPERKGALAESTIRRPVRRSLDEGGFADSFGSSRRAHVHPWRREHGHRARAIGPLHRDANVCEK